MCRGGGERRPTKKAIHHSEGTHLVNAHIHTERKRDEARTEESRKKKRGGSRWSEGTTTTTAGTTTTPTPPLQQPSPIPVLLVLQQQPPSLPRILVGYHQTWWRSREPEKSKNVGGNPAWSDGFMSAKRTGAKYSIFFC